MVRRWGRYPLAPGHLRLPIASAVAAARFSRQGSAASKQIPDSTPLSAQTSRFAHSSLRLSDPLPNRQERPKVSATFPFSALAARQNID